MITTATKETTMEGTNGWLVTVDHGYEGEKQTGFETLAEAEAFAAEKRQDPYVLRVSVEAYPS